MDKLLGFRKGVAPCADLSSSSYSQQESLLSYGVLTTHIIYSCSLPIWFPKEIADKMILELGVALRRELVGLMEKSELYHPRPRSSGSRRLSHDSSEGDRETAVSERYY